MFVPSLYEVLSLMGCVGPPQMFSCPRDLQVLLCFLKTPEKPVKWRLRLKPIFGLTAFHFK